MNAYESILCFATFQVDIVHSLFFPRPTIATPLVFIPITREASLDPLFPATKRRRRGRRQQPQHPSEDVLNVKSALLHPPTLLAFPARHRNHHHHHHHHPPRIKGRASLAKSSGPTFKLWRQQRRQDPAQALIQLRQVCVVEAGDCIAVFVVGNTQQVFENADDQKIATPLGRARAAKLDGDLRVHDRAYGKEQIEEEEKRKERKKENHGSTQRESEGLHGWVGVQLNTKLCSLAASANSQN